jgi:hypothetical protein
MEKQMFQKDIDIDENLIIIILKILSLKDTKFMLNQMIAKKLQKWLVFQPTLSSLAVNFTQNLVLILARTMEHSLV